MIALRSLQSRLAIGIGLVVGVLWIGVASITSTLLNREMDREFDSSLQETAQRILPVAVIDVLGREGDEPPQEVAAIRTHDELFTYVVRDNRGKVLLQSHKADLSIFSPYSGVGFSQNEHYRFYSDEALRGSITITVAEPLAHRRDVSRQVQTTLIWSLVLIEVISLLIIVFFVRRNFSPLRRLRQALAARGAYDLTPITVAEKLPTEIEPVMSELNQLLLKLRAAFEAERTFASNAAHELRTPLAGAIAQAQRLQSETQDSDAKKRASDIEATLKRLARLSEKLMQLARVEGGQLRTDHETDVRLILDLVIMDIRHLNHEAEIHLSKPETPVLSDLDPDALGILARNLIENALRHGIEGNPVEVTLELDGTLHVINEATPVSPELLARLTDRFERGGKTNEGSGLGLAIVHTICERTGADLSFHSPARDKTSGFEVVVHLPAEKA